MGMLDRCWFAGLLGHAFLLQAIIIVLRIATTYEAVSIGLDVVMIGLIGGAFGILPAIIALHTGRYIDRFGERVVLAAGSLAALGASLGLWLAPASLTILLVFSALTGVAQLLGVAGHHSAAARSTAALQAARFGQLTMFVSLAHMAGPLVFGIMASGRTVPDTGPIFLFAATCSVVLLLVTVFVRIPGRLAIPEITGLWHTVGSILRTKGYAPATTISVVLFSATDLLEAIARHFLRWTTRWQEDGFMPVRRAWMERALGHHEQPIGRRAFFRVEAIDDDGTATLCRDGLRRILTIAQGMKLSLIHI